ncbi:MCE family protein [Mycolicibacter heraklionensis]|uniref:MCE family protein n=1 Tax=Mycolicibacter heraklionensis TaxID=512402 RepID=UPI00069BA8C6|nr:MCE family protein [Mycolicibacter heraklionensis]
MSAQQRKFTAVALAALLVVSGGYLGYRHLLGPKTISAYFTTATAIYRGDQVRVAGVRVGTIAAVEPLGTKTKIVMNVDRNVSIPANAQAVIVAQSLIAARYVQLTPPYEDAGPTMPDGAEIPLDRTAEPVEWDEVKIELTRLAGALGPGGDAPDGAVSRFIDSTATALDGNGAKLRETLAQLSGAAKILANGSGDIAGTIKNLQVFVSALEGSNTQIVRFENRLATLSSVLNNNRSDLDAALSSLSIAVKDVQRFVSQNRGRTTEQIERLSSVTKNLADNRLVIEQVLHTAPTGLANYNNIYNPEQGSEAGSFVFNNFSNPVTLICAGLASVKNVTSEEGAKLCTQYLGPVLKYLSLNYLPFPVNVALGPVPRPGKMYYTQPDLIPGVVAEEPPPPVPATTSELLLPDSVGGTP